MSREPIPNDGGDAALAEALSVIGRGDLRPRSVLPLSDLSRTGAALLARLWSTWPEETRVAVVRRMARLAEERIELNFGRALRVALDDESATVRQLAVAALWEDEGRDLLPSLIGLLRTDPSQDVRAAAASGLGRFAVSADAGELDPAVTADLRTVLGSFSREGAGPDEVRRSCLEAVAAFSHDPEVWALIEAAYASDEPGMRACALQAMGRNLSPRWFDKIVADFESSDAELRYEAARASGELGDARAVPGLAELARDAEGDVRGAAIAALGQVGGQAAVRVLRDLAHDAGGDERDRIEAALEEAAIVVDPLRAPV